ncbi:DUF805 domain-containing protein [Luteipulveratus halotolerans]|uniref:DUF805 domain-containing protein n=1 Tax=Luteipulveratus halotolerans TaxID=1631356 RepID=UPI0008FBFCC1|nr:DUF805 domain-containing protein [Luteipulveratus halotolerans]
MELIDNYVRVLKKYADFNGRARRREFWQFFLVNFIIGLVLVAVDNALGLAPDKPEGTTGFYVSGGLLSVLYSLATLIPNIAVGARRLHDTNRSGWWQLIAFVPCVGFIILIVFWAQEGQRHPNQHGPDPKGGDGVVDGGGYPAVGGYPGSQPGQQGGYPGAPGHQGGRPGQEGGYTHPGGNQGGFPGQEGGFTNPAGGQGGFPGQQGGFTNPAGGQGGFPGQQGGFTNPAGGQGGFPGQEGGFGRPGGAQPPQGNPPHGQPPQGNPPYGQPPEGNPPEGGR